MNNDFIANCAGNILPDQEMSFYALNRKLQEMCRSVGLLGYNKM